jgi:hypothetical protein
LLQEHEVDIKVQQALLRHADIRTTMNIYTQAVPTAVREANRKVVKNILGKQGAIEAALRVPELPSPSKSVRALLRKSLKNQVAMISIPIARSIPSDDLANLNRTLILVYSHRLCLTSDGSAYLMAQI